MDFYMHAAHSPSSSSRVKGEGAASLHTTAYRIGLISTYSITNGKTAFKKYKNVIKQYDRLLGVCGCGSLPFEHLCHAVCRTVAVD